MIAYDGRENGIANHDSRGIVSAVARAVLVVMLLVGATRAAAQTPPAFSPSANPVSDIVRELVGRQAGNLTRSAELMPAEKYNFSPTPAQMTFGQLMVHIIQTNTALCAAASGAAPAIMLDELKKLSPTDSKESLVLQVRRSFDTCVENLRQVQDSQLAAEALMFGQHTGLSRGAALVTIAVDWADHYSTAATYLRLNAILPPSAQPPR